MIDLTVAPGLMRHAHRVLRAALASVFLCHGIDKYPGAGIADFGRAMDLPMVVAFLVELGEIGVGLLISPGGPFSGLWGAAITRLGALGLIVIMLGAVFIVHRGKWHLMGSPMHPMGGCGFRSHWRSCRWIFS